MRKRFIYFWIIVLAGLFFMWIFLPPLSHYRELKSEEDRLSRELKDLGEKVAALEEEKGLLQNDVEYLEKVIREEMGFVRPGEIVYKLVPAQTKAEQRAAAAPAIPQSEVAELPDVQ